jgi:NADH-quinone oxidoreductase subunit N
MWTPDAYEGAPTVVAGFHVHGSEGAAFAAFVRVFLSAYEPMRADWVPVLWALAILTMIVGTIVGVAQTKSEAHARVLEHRARRLPARRARRRQ